jgi:HTH-type transcriptional regulator/antitoxin HigA
METMTTPGTTHGTTTTHPVTTARRPMPRTMADLLDLHAPRPLRDDSDHEEAVELVDQLMRVSRPTRDQRDYAEVLVSLIEVYEREHHGAGDTDLTGLDLLRAVMEEAGLSGADIAGVLGVSPSLVSMILKGERSLTWTHAKALAERFALPPAAFMD